MAENNKDNHLEFPPEKPWMARVLAHLGIMAGLLTSPDQQLEADVAADDAAAAQLSTRLAIAHMDLRLDASTHVVLRTVLENLDGPTLHIARAAVLADGIRDQAQRLRAMLEPHIVDSFQLEGGKLVLDPRGIERIRSVSKMALLALARRSGIPLPEGADLNGIIGEPAFQGEMTDHGNNLLERNPPSGLSTRGLMSLRQRASSLTPASQEEITRTISDYLERLSRYLEANARAHAGLSAGVMMKLYENLQAIIDLLEFEETRGDVETIRDFRDSLLSFLDTLNSLITHMGRHIIPQAEEFLNELGDAGLNKLLRNIEAERRALENRGSEYRRLPGFMRAIRKNPVDPVVVETLDMAGRTLRDYLKMQSSRPVIPTRKKP